MEVLIGVSIIGFLIYKLLNKHKTASSNPGKEVKMVATQRDRHIEGDSNLSFYPIMRDSLKGDDSIIEVTGTSFKLHDVGLDGPEVPYWPHQYIYSYAELESATIPQKKFYRLFKEKFHQGIFLDLKGNTNYAFILLFDLLQTAKNAQTLEKLEAELKHLALNYPKTQSYCKSFLIQMMKERHDYDGISRVINSETYQNPYEETYYSLGYQFKKKLNLTDEQLRLLNKLYNPGNNFCGIEFCLTNTIQLYLKLVKSLNEIYSIEGSSLDQELKKIGKLVAVKHYRYHSNSYNYQYAIDSVVNELYTMLFRHSENALREFYLHKRKINTDVNYRGEIKANIDLVFSKLPLIFSTILTTDLKPDEKTEIELNAQNTTRWKSQLDSIMKETLPLKSEVFYKEVLKLGKLNVKNPSVENLYFEASKAIAKSNKEVSLKLYIHYLYFDLQSSSFDNKPIQKTIQKAIFSSPQQIVDFEKVIAQLVSSKDLDSALNSIPEIFKLKRKKIALDTTVISAVNKKHKETVELLDEILAEEYDDANSTIKAEQLNKEEISLSITLKSHDQPAPELAADFLTSTQRELLHLFEKNSLAIDQAEVEAFARAKSLFKNQLIESINDSCFERLDDLLIEEEDDRYIINENYYKQITQ